MARDGSGTYSLPAGSTITNGDTSDASDLNTPLADLEADANVARPIVAGGTGATTASAARTALGVAIGTDVQAHDDFLDDIAALTDPNADRAVGWDDSAGAMAFFPFGMHFIESQDASGDASLDFTGFDGTIYDAYVFVIGGLIPASDNVALLIRTSTNGGSSYSSTAGDYQFVRTVQTPSAVTAGGSASGTSISPCAGVGTAVGEAGVSGQVFIQMPHLEKKIMMNGQVSYVNSDGDFAGSTFFGYRTAEANVDAVQFLFASGNIEAGTITMYGLRNG